MIKDHRFLFIESKKSSLPELDYYIDFLKKYNKKIYIKKSSFEELNNHEKYDYIWIPLMNISLNSIFLILKNKKKGLKIILDVRSGSVGLFKGLKNIYKNIILLIIKPNFLIFLNKSVKKIFFISTKFFKCHTFLIDMPIALNSVNKNIPDYFSKKYRIIAVIKNEKEFYDFLKLRNKIQIKKFNKNDLVISQNPKVSEWISEIIKKNSLTIELKPKLKIIKYFELLELSCIHFIPYLNVKPFIDQTSTRLLDSILKKVFIISINSKTSNRIIDFFDYRNYSYLYENVNSIKSRIKVKKMNNREANLINKKLLIYKKNFDYNLLHFLDFIFKSS